MDKRSKGAYTLIGEGTVIKGEMSVPHAVRIDGTFEGTKFDTAEMLTIGATGTVEADEVTAKSAVVGGTLRGNLVVHDRVELEAKASLVGNLQARHIVINEGAEFRGNCSMDTGRAAEA
jgi:cytoskeletal protein CcmA (bactofilin family)